MDDTLASRVRQNINNYITGTTKVGKYVDLSLYDIVETIVAYKNEKHISGEYDSEGREKPFYSIGIPASNVWFRATDIDTKNIKVKAKQLDKVFISTIQNLLLQDWMNKYHFGLFLNEWGKSLADFGSSVIKSVEKDGEVKLNLVPWTRMVCDSIDFESDIQIEKLVLSVQDLVNNKMYDKETVKSLLEARTTRKNLAGENIDNNSNFIEVYEVHGVLPLSYLTDEEADEYTYVQQMHIISYVAKGNSSDEYEDFTLFKGKEKRSPYTLTHLLPDENFVLGFGAYRYLFQAQWMVNHTQKAIKDMLDHSTKIVYQTSDPTFLGQNADTSADHGDILITAPNAPLTQLNNSSHDISPLMAQVTTWTGQGKEITSTPDAITGATMPSGTAYRQVAVLNREAHSLFKVMMDTKSFYLTKILKEIVVPALLKKVDTTEELAAYLDSSELAKIDTMYINGKAAQIANNMNIETILSGKISEGVDTEGIKAGLKEDLSLMGNQRFFKPSELDDKTWKEIIKDAPWEVEYEITGETSDKEAEIATFTTIMQAVSADPTIVNNPLFRMLVETSGAISPIQLASISSTQQAQTTTNQPATTV